MSRANTMRWPERGGGLTGTRSLVRDSGEGGDLKASTLTLPRREDSYHYQLRNIQRSNPGCSPGDGRGGGRCDRREQCRACVCLRNTRQIYKAILDAVMEGEEGSQTRFVASARRPSPSPRLNSVLVKSSTPTCRVVVLQFHV
ncbi:hypothetical protein E2C01_024961 [Portunus trituberculatus]|uniref:Uncharacterized protein n=1 Tax=Portunus trituberculatus TaxID=210409 RepID=A0A5B7EE81_PORTR|nr:hypothetical protein [Portunus trituberculatus]